MSKKAFTVLMVLAAGAACGAGAAEADTGKQPAADSQPAAAPLRCMQRFRFKDFAIGIWRTPPIDQLTTAQQRQQAADLYFEHCKNLGLTVVKSNKVSQLEHWLAAAEKVQLPMIVHCWKYDDEAWGPNYPASPKSSGGRQGSHYAGLGEFKWLYAKGAAGTYGGRQAIVGYLLNDNCGLHDYTVSIADFLLKNDPGAIPWMSTNPNPAGQAKVPMPVVTSQLYFYLANRGIRSNPEAMALWRQQEAITPFIQPTATYFEDTLRVVLRPPACACLPAAAGRGSSGQARPRARPCDIRSTAPPPRPSPRHTTNPSS